MLFACICELLGITYPILGSDEWGIAGADLVAAISEAGGFGQIGAMTTCRLEWLRGQIHRVREQTKDPFGVGFISSFFPRGGGGDTIRRIDLSRIAVVTSPVM